MQGGKAPQHGYWHHSSGAHVSDPHANGASAGGTDTAASWRAPAAPLVPAEPPVATEPPLPLIVPAEPSTVPPPVEEPPLVPPPPSLGPFCCSVESVEPHASTSEPIAVNHTT